MPETTEGSQKRSSGLLGLSEEDLERERAEHPLWWGIERLITEQELDLGGMDIFKFGYDPEWHAFKLKLYRVGDRADLITTLDRMMVFLQLIRKDVARGIEADKETE